MLRGVTHLLDGLKRVLLSKQFLFVCLSSMHVLFEQNWEQCTPLKLSDRGAG